VEPPGAGEVQVRLQLLSCRTLARCQVWEGACCGRSVSVRRTWTWTPAHAAPATRLGEPDAGPPKPALYCGVNCPPAAPQTRLLALAARVQSALSALSALWTLGMTMKLRDGRAHWKRRNRTNSHLPEVTVSRCSSNAGRWGLKVFCR